MNSFDINKIIAAIIFTVVVVIGINKLSDVVYSVKAPIAKLKVEAKQINQISEKKEGSLDLNEFLALGSVEHGKKIFSKCSACHSIDKGGGNRIGPALWSVLGRKMGSLSDYKYSKALVNFGKDWGFEEMNAFLIKPSKYIKGTKMAFAGLKEEKDRASIILYLNKQSDNPLAKP